MKIFTMETDFFPWHQMDWRVDGHDEADSRFSQFFERT